jgi:hypothetical protein
MQRSLTGPAALPLSLHRRKPLAMRVPTLKHIIPG